MGQPARRSVQVPPPTKPKPRKVLALDPTRAPMPDASPAWLWHRVIELWVPADTPTAKGNRKHAFVVHGRAMVAGHAPSERHERLLRRALAAALPPDWRPLEGAVRFDVRVDLLVPVLSATHPTSWRVRALAGDPACGPTAHKATPDRGNLLKMIEDAASGLLYVDDAQVLDGEARKRWSTSPGWRVVLSRPVGEA